ncbi:MAG: OmpA family protein [Gammaproteobacteria bacterium]|nr:OmpA family protein [Gammaproteobacteria bacterium]MDH3433911.1 OmpA family protein [Gammaproteobacteria bacterium]
MAVNRRFAPCVLVLTLLLGIGSANAQDELRKTFFKEADAAKAAAEAANAQLLAPRSYERGSAEYNAAETALERGRNIETVRSNAADAARHFRTATTAAQLASTALAQVMKSRQDAANARAPELSAEIWEEAQRKFGDAIRLLERGDLKGAKRRDIEATSLYRDAELIAIKAQYLNETRQLLADADRARVGRYAPITLNKAKQLLADAERELNENRYDTDLPRSLARQANYEAKHAIYLSEIVRKVRDRDLSAEVLVLEWEKPLRDISGAADVVPDMEDGPDRLAAELVAYIDQLRNENQALGQEKAENETRLADMEEELAALDERLGGATAERAALIQRLEAQARVKQQFQQVEKMFTPAEARVFREGNNIILRLDGLTFDSGASQIKPQSFDLLAKVEKAIDVFPRSELIIEGHTDSHGGDELNQKLSQQRAESVQQYMINAMRIPTYRLIATGYGETRPIASNETESGRERNRRIDIVIRPNIESS